MSRHRPFFFRTLLRALLFTERAHRAGENAMVAWRKYRARDTGPQSLVIDWEMSWNYLVTGRWDSGSGTG